MELNKEIGSFSADLAFFDNLQHKYVLGAKIENAKEEIDSQKSLYDQAYLVGRGWNMYYMFYHNWLRSADIEIKNILNQLK